MIFGLARPVFGSFFRVSRLVSNENQFKTGPKLEIKSCSEAFSPLRYSEGPGKVAFSLIFHDLATFVPLKEFRSS